MLSYRLIKIHRKYTSAYLLCDKASLRLVDDIEFFQQRDTGRETDGGFFSRLIGAHGSLSDVVCFIRYNRDGTAFFSL